MARHRSNLALASRAARLCQLCYAGWAEQTRLSAASRRVLLSRATSMLHHSLSAWRAWLERRASLPPASADLLARRASLRRRHHALRLASSLSRWSASARERQLCGEQARFASSAWRGAAAGGALRRWEGARRAATAAAARRRQAYSFMAARLQRAVLAGWRALCVDRRRIAALLPLAAALLTLSTARRLLRRWRTTADGAAAWALAVSGCGQRARLSATRRGLRALEAAVAERRRVERARAAAERAVAAAAVSRGLRSWVAGVTRQREGAAAFCAMRRALTRWSTAAAADRRGAAAAAAAAVGLRRSRGRKALLRWRGEVEAAALSGVAAEEARRGALRGCLRVWRRLAEEEEAAGLRWRRGVRHRYFVLLHHGAEAWRRRAEAQVQLCDAREHCSTALRALRRRHALRRMLQRSTAAAAASAQSDRGCRLLSFARWRRNAAEACSAAALRARADVHRAGCLLARSFGCWLHLLVQRTHKRLQQARQLQLHRAALCRAAAQRSLRRWRALAAAAAALATEREVRCAAALSRRAMPLSDHPLDLLGPFLP